MSVKVGLKVIEKWNESMEDEILEYEKETPEKGQIVFYGPSNFTRWSTKWGMTPLNEAVVGTSGKQCCINRGFGSSCPEHHLYYYFRAVRPLNPRVLVYFPGIGNGRSFGYTAEEQWFLSQRVISYAKEDFPGIKIYLCGINLNKVKSEGASELDVWMREYAKKAENCKYVDITGYTPLQRDDIYAPDNKHYNQKGYEIYAELFREVLKDELALY